MFRINNTLIGDGCEPYIIAEISANHNGSLGRAKQSIKAAADAGVHAVKFQSYSADTMTINCDKPDFLIKNGLWRGYKLYDLYREASTPFEWHSELFSYAAEVGVACFSTPFDESAFELLQELGAPAYKIASFELTDLPLIRRVGSSGKPLLISTGMANEEEISEAVRVALDSGASAVLLFHCISSYPAPIEDSNLRMILSLKKRFAVDVGLSDHSLGIVAAQAAVALGACAIEKHFTLSRDDHGPDSEFSMEPSEFRALVEGTRATWLALGNETFSRPDIEKSNVQFRRSVYFVRDLKAGDLITKKDIRRIRPGFGLPPKFFDELIGKRTACDVSFGDAVTWAKVI